MRYPAKELKAEAYKAYSKDAFNDEERGVAYFAHGYRYAGKTGEADDILCALIDTTRYIETSLPGVDKIIITADDGSDKEIKMFPIDWFWIVDFDLINWYGMGNERSSGENRAPVSEEFYDMWENYRSRASSHKKKHPKPSAKDGIQIENCGADYFLRQILSRRALMRKWFIRNIHTFIVSPNLNGLQCQRIGQSLTLNCVIICFTNANPH